jgi:hypothetical protein
MKKPVYLLFLLLLCTSCGIYNSKARNQNHLQPSSQLQNGLKDFIGGYHWQDIGTRKRPVIAVTDEELIRLRAAWATQGDEHKVLANRISQADKAIESGITFPPEGGQHNQWYQCDSCQRSLETIDAHHHKCPQCGNIYSGFPYDNVLYSRQHNRNISMAEDAAWAWVITGEKKYADFTAAILLGYAERYLNYPMIHAGVNDNKIDIAAQKNGKYVTAGHMLSQTLDESNAMIPAVTAFDLIYNSNALNEDEKKKIEEKFFRAMADCINCYKSGKSNWQTWHNAALLYAGAVLGDEGMVSQAILDDKNGFVSQMKISVTPEGMWYENSWDYHYYTLSGMTAIAEGARRLGMDLYSFEPLRKMYLLPFAYRMSDGSLPRFGDGVRSSPDVPSVNEKAYAAYKDDRLLSTLPEKPTWDKIVLGRKVEKKEVPMQLTSALVPGSGHAILATNGPGNLTAAITFGPYGGFHGHFDKLSFVFFGFNEELGVDPGRAASQAYRLPIHTEWYKATTGHNAVLVDGKSQTEAGGQLLAYTADTSYSAVAADAGPAFSNVRHRRFLMLAPSYLLVVDELQATDGQEHTFDWLYHNKGNNVSCSLDRCEEKLAEMPRGYIYLNDVSAFNLKKEQLFNVTFSGEKLTTNLTLIGQPGDRVFTATGPLSSLVDQVPMVIVRRKGQKIRFITVIEPVPLQSEPDVRSLNLISGNPLEMSIECSKGEDRILFPGQSLEEFSITNKSESSGQRVVLKTKSN